MRRCLLSIATKTAVALTLAPATLLAATDWPQWRGPHRNGRIESGPALAVGWPEGGPPKIWESERVPTANEGGLGSVAVGEGLAVVYSNWKYREPVVTRTVTDEALKGLGWVAEKPPAEVLQRLEEARLSDERAGLAPSALNAWIEGWIKEHLTDETLAKKFRGYVQDRLRRGRTALDLASLDKLAEVRRKTFATEEELERWLRDHGFAEAEVAAVMAAVPKTVEKADDVILAWDAHTGALRWKARFPGQPHGWDNSATPLLAQGRCYVLGSGKTFYCLNLADGSLVWKSPTYSDSGSSSALWLDGRVFVVAGRLIAYEAATGAELWSQPQVRHTHTSPVVWRHGEERLLLCNSGNELVCVRPADGAVVWKTSPGGHNSTVVVEGDIAIVQSEGAEGLTAFRLSPAGPEKLWTVAHKDRGSTPVVYEGHLYVVSGGGAARTLCIRLETGEIVWEQKGPNQEISSPIVADGKILAFANHAKDLFLMRASPDGYALLARARVDGAHCTTPALADGRLYLRTVRGVACYDLRAER